MKNVLLFMAAMSLTAVSAAPEVKSVLVRQLWPWSDAIRIEYTLDKTPGSVDIAIAAEYDGKPLDGKLVMSTAKGDVLDVSGAAGAITLDPVKIFGTGKIDIDLLSVTLTASEASAYSREVLYKIFDLASGECENVTRGALLGERYGSIETDFAKLGESFGVDESLFGDLRFNTSLDEVIIWTGVTNKLEYKTSKMVMRKIPAKNKSYMMGFQETENYQLDAGNAPLHEVSFTNDYYVAVFEFTQGQAEALTANMSPKPQYELFFTNKLDVAVRPIPLKYQNARVDLVKWPWGGREETGNSFVKALRERTGLMFDLPTEAQWEYACRAGTATDFNCGLSYQKNGKMDLALHNAVSRSQYNSGFDAYNLSRNETNYAVRAAIGGTAAVGSYAPNAWGLYDMHGNVAELCLDYFQADISGCGGPDPWGPSPGAGVEDYLLRIRRGGGFYLSQSYFRPSYRSGGKVNTASAYHGGRFCLMVFE